MSREVICRTLGIAPELWPPDHYTLIGLPPDRADSASVETRVQELSARLRHYQLVYPDEVTDALNRLAQALVCLTDPAARAKYDADRRTQESGSPPYELVPPTHFVPRPATRHPAPAESVAEAVRSVRRANYRRIAATRRLRSAWRDLHDWMANPGRTIRDPSDA